MPGSMKKFKKYKNTKTLEGITKYLVPNRKDDSKWAEIEINYNSHVFTCQMKTIKKLPQEWEETKDFTFASSLLNEFMMKAKYIEEE
jgi:hypothetical protein